MFLGSDEIKLCSCEDLKCQAEITSDNWPCFRKGKPIDATRRRAAPKMVGVRAELRRAAVAAVADLGFPQWVFKVTKILFNIKYKYTL